MELACLNHCNYDIYFRSGGITSEKILVMCFSVIQFREINLNYFRPWCSWSFFQHSLPQLYALTNTNLLCVYFLTAREI